MQQTFPKWIDSSSWQTPRWKTAIGRSSLSRPMNLAVTKGLIREDSHVLDFGCGRQGDVERLNASGIHARGFDPHYKPDTTAIQPTDVVSLIYVLNVIEDSSEREEVLQFCHQLAIRALVVSVQPKRKTDPVEVITSIGTFQRYYTPPEWHQWMQKTLGCISVVYPEPGVAFVYK